MDYLLSREGGVELVIFYKIELPLSVTFVNINKKSLCYIGKHLFLVKVYICNLIRVRI